MIVKPYSIEIAADGYRINGNLNKNRVSTILKVTKQIDDYAGVDTYYRDLGTASALAIKYDVEKTLDETTIDQDIWPRLEAWRKFVADTHYKPIDCELALYSEKDDFCGTLDHYGTLNDRRVVIDTKCTKTAKKWWKFQLHAYRRLLGEHAIHTDELYALMLKEDATYELVPYSSQPNELWDAIMVLYRNALAEDKRRKNG